jgi:hypothetical protein
MEICCANLTGTDVACCQSAVSPSRQRLEIDPQIVDRLRETVDGDRHRHACIISSGCSPTGATPPPPPPLFGDRLHIIHKIEHANDVSCRFACSEDAKYRMEGFSSKVRARQKNAHIPSHRQTRTRRLYIPTSPIFDLGTDRLPLVA